MALKLNEWPTLVDVSKRLDPNGAIDMIAETLAQTNEILDDAPFLEGNLPTGHRGTIRTGLPEVAWRILNYGVKQSKSRTQQVTDSCGMLEAYGQVDKDLAKLNGNKAGWRYSEDQAFLEAMSQEMASTIFYGGKDESFIGLSPRYNDLSAPNKQNIIDCGGTANLTSIWLICWDDDTINMRFPKGSKAGLDATDLGEQTVSDEEGGLFQAFRMHYQWKSGLHVKDWRYGVRLCNIDVTKLEANPKATVDLWNALIRAYHRIPNRKKGKLRLYANGTILEYLDLQSLNKENVRLTQMEVDGQDVEAFRKIPLRHCDALMLTEERVV